MLETYLEQISLSSAAIAELPFPPPKIFTNALIHPHDITALIRDTEAHERALFTVASSEPGVRDRSEKAPRKSTIYGPNGERDVLGNTGVSYKGSKPASAVSQILGGDLMSQIHQGPTTHNKDRAEVDVDLLLTGAEKLCNVYPIKGAPERIGSLRKRYERLTLSIAHLEARAAEQAAQLNQLNRPKSYIGRDCEDDDVATDDDVGSGQHQLTVQDLKREEQEVRELEKKKRGLQERVSGMEKDLGGLSR